MLYDLCRPVASVKRPDCSYHTGLNDPTFMSIFIRRSLEGVMIYTTSPPYSRTRRTLWPQSIYMAGVPACITDKSLTSCWPEIRMYWRQRPPSLIVRQMSYEIIRPSRGQNIFHMISFDHFMVKIFSIRHQSYLINHSTISWPKPSL